MTIRAIMFLVVVALFALGCDDGVDPCTPTNGGIEACNDGIDNDCDGQVDEGCGTCTPTNGGIEACGDLIDNDCDGQVDEGCTSGQCTDGTSQGCGATPTAGVCQQRCVGGTWGTCLPTGAAEEVCGNGLDDNCNNSIDEYCTDPECEGTETEECGGSPGTNLCTRTCQSSRWTACAPNPPNTGEEVCDGRDNDCDGQIDEGDCSCDTGDEMWCGGTPEYHSCHQTCNSGTWSACLPTSGHAEEEDCGDGEDNDCDGQIDEAEPCTRTGCGDGLERCVGTERGDCMNDSWECIPGDEVNEACTGEDRGICDPGERSRTCSASCTWNTWGSCTGVVGPASSESCNGLDDDCDGSIDESVTGSDSYGSNSSQGSCRDLGTDPEDLYLYPILESYSEDWFCFQGNDGALMGWEDIEITLTNLPGDLDVYLFRDDPETGAFTELASSTGSGTADESIEFNEDFGGEDTARYYVRVDSYYGSSACYTLWIDGLR